MKVREYNNVYTNNLHVTWYLIKNLKMLSRIKIIIRG